LSGIISFSHRKSNLKPGYCPLEHIIVGIGDALVLAQFENALECKINYLQVMFSENEFSSSNVEQQRRAAT
jgi:hypothetical protein